MRMLSGQNASVFLVDTWNFFLGDEIPQDIYQKWLKKINGTIMKNRNIPKVYIDFYEYVIKSSYFKEKYPSQDSRNQFIQIKYSEFLKFLNQNVKLSEKPSIDLSFNLK